LAMKMFLELNYLMSECQNKKWPKGMHPDILMAVSFTVAVICWKYLLWCSQ
jgi:hypothetical protein